MKIFSRYIKQKSNRDREIEELKNRIKALEQELVRERGLKTTYKILAGRA